MDQKSDSKKNNSFLSDIPVTFRVEESIHEYIQDQMIEQRQFNKSKIQREIFMLGLAQYKKMKQK